MGVFASAAGRVVIELTSADVAGMLSAMGNAGIEIFHVKRAGDLTVYLTIRRWDYRRVRALADRRGESLVIRRKRGIYWPVKSLAKRPVILAGIMLMLLCAVYLPSRVLFIRVEGNGSVPDRLIIDQASRCGICFGASRRDVRSEKVKNALLSAVPQLQWAAVNTSGCVATITVRERGQTDQTQRKNGVSSIISACDGVVVEATAEKGNLLCKVGQAVKAGEVLISGYTDCGLSIRATQAEGEVYARTKRELTTVMPLAYLQKGTVREEKKKYGLLIGKNRINFYKDSGISDTSCDKMYLEYYLSLPGGFRLPIALTVESFTYYEQDTVWTDQDALLLETERFSDAYVAGQMISGSILDQNRSVEFSQDLCMIHEEYTCHEMIGRVKNEEIIGSHGKSD